jgi:hypothetical protein
MSSLTKAICENLVIIELLRHGWHAVNLNTVNNTPNADLIAIKGKKRITIQVKGMDGNEDKTFRHHIAFSRTCKGYLIDGEPFFNSKIPSSIQVRADYFVGVTQAKNVAATFLILPIREAERTARSIAKWWYAVPKRNGGRRSPNFASQVAIRPEGIKKNHQKKERYFYEKVHPFINKWSVLGQQSDPSQKRKRRKKITSRTNFAPRA